MKIRLTRKFANLINGIDLSKYRIGDVVEMPRRDAEMLIAEEWAEHFRERGAPQGVRSEAADKHRRPKARK